MLQSASTLFLILNLFFSLNYILTVSHPMKSDVEFSTDGIMSAIKTFRTLKVWIREDQPVLNERKIGSFGGLASSLFELLFSASVSCVPCCRDF